MTNKKEAIQVYANNKRLHHYLHNYCKTEKHVDDLLQFITELSEEVKPYHDWLKDETHKERHIQSEEQSAFNKLEELIAYCEKYDAKEQAEVLKTVSLPLPTSKPKFTNNMAKTGYKKELKQRLKDAGFKNLDKLVTDIYTIIQNPS